MSLQGVMLTHGNLRYQLDNLSFFLKPKPGERSLSLLPPWHIYERSAAYYVFSQGVGQVPPSPTSSPPRPSYPSPCVI